MPKQKPEIETVIKYARTPPTAATQKFKTPNDVPTVMSAWEETRKRYYVKNALNWTVVTGSGADAKKEKKQMTWGEYYENIVKVAKAFIALGLEKGNAVNIIGFNSPEWYISDFAAIFAGGVACGVYTTNTPEQCHYVADHSEANIVCVENTNQLKKYLKIRFQLPKLKAIVVMNNKIDCNVEEELRNALSATSTESSSAAIDSSAKLVYTWEELFPLAETISQQDLQARMDAQKPTDTCTLIYTSGTTGNPKGVMIAHYNVMFTILSSNDLIDINSEDRLVTYLPLSHIAEQIVSLYASLVSGASVFFADAGVLKGGMLDFLKEVKPTVFLGVPRVWEKLQSGIKVKSDANTGTKKKIFDWAKGVGLKGGYAKQEGKGAPWGYGAANKLVFSKIAAALGLDECRGCFTSAAPISKDTLEFFLSLGIPVFEIFGMSELTGPATLSLPDKYKTGKVGFPVPGVEIKIAEDGEICVRGFSVTTGYFKNPTATQETIDESGWLHTGDIGVLDNDGFLQITDRKKELLITAGGENIPPAILEGMLRSVSCISQAVVVGDRKPYLCALVSLDAERLEKVATDCGATCGKDVTKAAEDKTLIGYLQSQIEEKVNARLPQVQTIKRIAIIPELTIDGGELTPTMKLKRRIIYEKHQGLIDSFYASARD